MKKITTVIAEWQQDDEVIDKNINFATGTI